MPFPLYQVRGGSGSGGGNDGGAFNHRRNSASVALLLAAAATVATTTCTPGFLATNATSPVESSSLGFPPDCLEYDHYQGVTIHLERLSPIVADDDATFAKELQQQLQLWKDQGRIRGVWIHVPAVQAAAVATCVQLGFDFHMVIAAAASADASATTQSASTTTTHMEHSSLSSVQPTNVLVLSRWLPLTPSRLPAGPTHQVGVGCLVWHPADWNTSAVGDGRRRRLLVVREKSGPAAAYRLWKLPTGLADPGEDIHVAALRELYEETGLVATMDGLLLFRQAHSTPPPKNLTVATKASTSNDTSSMSSNTEVNNTAVQRKASDLFFVCQMTVESDKNRKNNDDDDDNEAYWKERFTACPEEIEAIQWMTVEDYCAQKRWQGSPVYIELNRAILQAASSSVNKHVAVWEICTLPLRHGDETHTNTLFKSKYSL